MSERQVLRALPLRARTLPCVEYAKDLQSITPHSIRDQIGLVGNCPFAGMFHPTFAAHGRKLSQPVDAGENGIREVVSGFWIFESDVARFVFQIFECFFKLNLKLIKVLQLIIRLCSKCAQYGQLCIKIPWLDLLHNILPNDILQHIEIIVHLSLALRCQDLYCTRW